MAQNNIVPIQKITDAAGGNVALREILQGLATNTNLQQQATTTSTGKNVPAQAKATVSFLRSTYIVEIENPGAVSPTSALQAAQAGQAATAATNIAPVVAIYHQIRCATTPSFNIASNVTTFGGNTGSAQTYWTISTLPAGQYYFQLRSSYDGVNWNLWRNANGGQQINKQPDGVTVETATNSVWALFALPGQQLIGFGAGIVADQDTFGTPTGLYTSAMSAIPGPNGFQHQDSNLAHGIIEESIKIVTPDDTSGLTGPPDYPTLVTMKYQDGSGNQWPGSSNIFAFGCDPLGGNVQTIQTSQGTWYVFTLPGGAQLAVASGTISDAAALVIPTSTPWVSAANSLAQVSPLVGFNPSVQAHGINTSNFDGSLVAHITFSDGGSNVWSSTGNFFIVAWSPGYPTASVTGGKFLVFDTPSGTSVAIGGGRVGTSATGGYSFGLPTGFDASKMLAFATPQNFFDSGHPMAGVYQCSASGTFCNLSYNDTENNFWSGDVNWLAFCWQ